MTIPKELKLEDINYQKELLITITSLSMEKNIYVQAINCDIKWYAEIRNLTTGQGENYAIGCLLYYDYIRNHYKLIAVDLSRQKELDADPKAIQQLEFVGQLQGPDNAIVANETIFVLTILEKNKETRLNFSRKCNSIIKDGKLSSSERQTNK